MTIAILATGDELIHGDTLNTNGHEIAHALSSEGLPLGLHLTCSDKEADIVTCLQFLAEKHDIIILIGGLGPTTDDLTRFALAKYTGDVLIQHSDALAHVQNRLQNAQVNLNEGNLQQCLFPTTAALLPNPHGTAVGCSYQWNNKLFFLLPGPPRECLPMFHHSVLPLLQKMEHSTKQMLKWRIFGLAESEIAATLEEALSSLDCQTGYRLDAPYIEFKVRCSSNLVHKVKEIIDPILAPHMISTLEKKASEHLSDLIVTNNVPITLIDDATGGLLQTLLTHPNTKKLVHWNTLHDSKLYFHLRGLEEYWQQQSPNGSTQLIIYYSNQYQEGKETHSIPYRSPLVIHYAAEWLSFRIIQLINQLH
jgi:molybdenum cofactor synthesis domain-containing protein